MQAIIIGSDSIIKPNPTPIEFCEELNLEKEFGETGEDPKDYNYVELICRAYSNQEPQYDLIFAYDSPDARSEGILFLGHWNDGV